MSFVKLFESTQTGAPSLSGTAGNLISLLDAVLVNGFNLKSINSITRSGSTATATVAAGHGYRENDVVLQAGAGQTEYNGEFRIFNVTSTTYQFTVTGSPATPATGTITAKIAPLGWTKAYTGTNKVAFFLSDPTATGCLLRDDDTNAKYAIVAVYETMTDIDTGSGMFADTTSVILKSSTSDAVTRKWTLIGDNLAFYLFTAWDAANLAYYEGHFFGDYPSYKSGDAYNCAISASYSSSSPFVGANNNFSATTNALPGRKLPRAYTQLSGSISFWTNALSYSGTLQTYTSPIDNGVHLTPVYMVDTSLGSGTFMPRGVMPGWYFPVHSTATLPAHATIVDNIPALPGRRFYFASARYNTADLRAVIDLTGPWR